MSNKFYGAIGISGGADGALDDIDGSNLANGDGSFVIETANNYAAFYELDSDSAAAQVVPTIMQPDTNGGDKRWILRGLKLSSVSLYEPGTTNLLTITQSTGNVTVDNTYDTGIITFKGENTGDATLLVLDPAGSVDLYYAGTKEGETISGGFKATNSLTIAATTNVTGILDEDAMTSNSAVSLATQQSIKAYVDSGTITMTNKTLTSPIINTILAKTAENGIVIIADGAAELYYAGVKTFETADEYVSITGNGGKTILIGLDGTSCYFASNAVSDPIVLQAYNASSTYTNVFKGDPDGAAELYYAGVKKLETSAIGVDIADSNIIRFGAGADLDILSDGTNGIIQHDTSANLTIQQRTPTLTSAVFDGAGAVELYYAGTVSLSTLPAGMQLHNAGTAFVQIKEISGFTQIYSFTHGNGISLYGESAAGATDVPMFKAVPDGAASLFYNGTEVVDTLADGLRMRPGKCLTLAEITTPTALADYGKIYTKTDNKLYFQSGDGVEHEIAYV